MAFLRLAAPWRLVDPSQLGELWAIYLNLGVKPRKIGVNAAFLRLCRGGFAYFLGHDGLVLLFLNCLKSAGRAKGRAMKIRFRASFGFNCFRNGSQSAACRRLFRAEICGICGNFTTAAALHY